MKGLPITHSYGASARDADPSAQSELPPVDDALVQSLELGFFYTLNASRRAMATIVVGPYPQLELHRPGPAREGKRTRRSRLNRSGGTRRGR